MLLKIPSISAAHMRDQYIDFLAISQSKKSRSMNHEVWITKYKSRSMNHESMNHESMNHESTNHEVRITRYESRSTNHELCSSSLTNIAIAATLDAADSFGDSIRRLAIFDHIWKATKISGQISFVCTWPLDSMPIHH